MATVASFEVTFGKHIIISPYSPGFDPKAVHVPFIVNEVALKQDFLPVFPFEPIGCFTKASHSFQYY
jgi:hypothetical protein